MMVPPSPKINLTTSSEISLCINKVDLCKRTIHACLPLCIDSNQDCTSKTALVFIDSLRDSFIDQCVERVKQWNLLLNRAILAKKEMNIDYVEEQRVSEALKDVHSTLKHSHNSFSHEKMKLYFVDKNHANLEKQSSCNDSNSGDLIHMAAEAITSMRSITKKREKVNERGSPPLKKRLRPVHISMDYHDHQKPVEQNLKSSFHGAVRPLAFEITLLFSLPGFEVQQIPLRALGGNVTNDSLSRIEDNSSSDVDFTFQSAQLLDCMKVYSRKIVRVIAETYVVSIRSKYENLEELESSNMPPPPPRRPLSTSCNENKGMTPKVTIPSLTSEQDHLSHFPLSPPPSCTRNKLPAIVSPPLCYARSTFSRSSDGNSCEVTPHFLPVCESPTDGKEEICEEFLLKTSTSAPCMPSLSSHSSPSDVEETVRALTSLKYTQVCNEPRNL